MWTNVSNAWNTLSSANPKRCVRVRIAISLWGRAYPPAAHTRSGGRRGRRPRSGGTAPPWGFLTKLQAFAAIQCVTLGGPPPLMKGEGPRF
jgi:hypothetical protein